MNLQEAKEKVSPLEGKEVTVRLRREKRSLSGVLKLYRHFFRISGNLTESFAYADLITGEAEVQEK